MRAEGNCQALVKASGDNRGAQRTLFIGGIGRSGTTVLERSLGTDPRVASLGEVTHLWDRSLRQDELCGCRRPFSECPFWISVGDLAFGGWSKVDTNRVMYLKHRVDRSLRTPQLAFLTGSQAWRSEVTEYADYYVRLYRAAAAVSGAEIVIDSSKQASLPWVLMHSGNLDLRVLHCVRDSRAVAYSWTKKVTRPESQGGSPELMHRYSPSKLSLKWMQHNIVIEGLRLRGVRSLRLRYEDWAADPVQRVQQVLAFAGLQESEGPAKIGPDWVDLKSAHTCSGNPMRFSTGHIVIRRDEKWRQAFPRRSQRLVTALTAPFLIAYGYKTRTR